MYNTSETPRYYPYGSPESAGQAHLRLHEATRNQGIKIRGGNPGMTDADLINRYEQAYNSSGLEGIRGDNQGIYMFFNPIDEMPKLKWTGVPYLF